MRLGFNRKYHCQFKLKDRYKAFSLTLKMKGTLDPLSGMSASLPDADLLARQFFNAFSGVNFARETEILNEAFRYLEPKIGQQNSKLSEVELQDFKGDCLLTDGRGFWSKTSFELRSPFASYLVETQSLMTPDQQLTQNFNLLTESLQDQDPFRHFKSFLKRFPPDTHVQVTHYVSGTRISATRS